ncbi:hypothetical protein MYOV011v1_p0317 [Vibrio phage 6E35.1a]|nr:hypothetical protein MYOV011v1_p0317 [Vibrio phage 6E35.1a]
MINLDIHTLISSEAQVDSLIMFSTSFRLHHADNAGVIKCVVLPPIDIESLPSIDGVDYVRTFTSKYVFLSVDNFFINKIYAVYSAHRERNSIRSYFNDDESTDFMIVNDNDGEDVENIHMNINFSFDSHGDRNDYYKRLVQMKDVVSINTKKFKLTDRTQINSLYTLLFPWETYFDSMRRATGLSEEFISDVMFNCQRFSHGIVYRHSGLLNVS